MTAFILLSLTAPRPALTFPKPHYPLLCTITLASLVKGEVLSPEKIRATTGGIASSPPPRLTTPLPKPHHPLLYTITLASLVKGEVLSPEKIRATTGGIASPPPFAPHQPFQNRTIPRKALSPLPLNERFVGFASVQSWSFAVGASCTDFLRPLVSIRA